MKLSITFIFLSFLQLVLTKKCLLNVGTVLFTESDITKLCWSNENIALLTSRMILEDILPSPDVLIVNNDQFVTDIIDYFRVTLEVVRKMTYGKARHIMLLALTDLLGGYVYHLVLPLTKYAYYAGSVEYTSVMKLYSLYDELKCFLRTNGQGWTKPVKGTSQHLDIQPIPLQSPAPKTDPCKGLIYYQKSNEGDSSCGVVIPMPFFDSKSRPTAIAVPFKTYGLRNIESKAAAYILVKFYIAASKCMAVKHASPESVQKFNNDFFSWINKKVYPHLCDEKFYSAFAGVLRIVETLKQNGAGQAGGAHKELGQYNVMPEEKEIESEEGFGGAPGEIEKKKTSNFILIALLVTIFIWFCLGSLFICYRIRTSKDKQTDKELEGSKSTPTKSTTSKTSTMESTEKPSRGSMKASSEEKSPSSSSAKISKPTPKKKQPSPSVSRTSPSGSASSSSTKKKKKTLSASSEESDRYKELVANDSRTLIRRRSTKANLNDFPNADATSSTSKKSEDLSKADSSYVSEESIKSIMSRNYTEEPDVASTKASLRDSKDTELGKGQKDGVFFPATFACHTSMTGKYTMGSTSEDYTSETVDKRPLVFGYDFETSSSSAGSTAGDEPSEGGSYVAGEMSK